MNWVIPILLDPVGAGASALRTNTAVELMKELKLTVIRGNISEIKTLALGSGTTKGVDADVADKVTDENLDDSIRFVKNFAKESGSIVAVTGAIDLVSDGENCYVIRNGRPEMGQITGTGCQLSGMMTAFVAANPDNQLEAAAAAVCTDGPGRRDRLEPHGRGRRKLHLPQPHHRRHLQHGPARSWRREPNMKCDKKNLLLYAVTDRHWLEGRTLHERGKGEPGGRRDLCPAPGERRWTRSIFWRRPRS